MTTKEKIERKGYKVTFFMNGGVLAEKGQKSYKAENITRLFNLLFK